MAREHRRRSVVLSVSAFVGVGVGVGVVCRGGLRGDQAGGGPTAQIAADCPGRSTRVRAGVPYEAQFVVQGTTVVSRVDFDGLLWERVDDLAAFRERFDSANDPAWAIELAGPTVAIFTAAGRRQPLCPSRSLRDARRGPCWPPVLAGIQTSPASGRPKRADDRRPAGGSVGGVTDDSRLFAAYLDDIVTGEGYWNGELVLMPKNLVVAVLSLLQHLYEENPILAPLLVPPVIRLDNAIGAVLHEQDAAS